MCVSLNAVQETVWLSALASTNRINIKIRSSDKSYVYKFAISFVSRSMRFKCINKKHIRPCSCYLSHNTAYPLCQIGKWFTYQNKWEYAPVVYNIAKWNKLFASQPLQKKTREETCDAGK